MSSSSMARKTIKPVSNMGSPWVSSVSRLLIHAASKGMNATINIKSRRMQPRGLGAAADQGEICLGTRMGPPFRLKREIRSRGVFLVDRGEGAFADGPPKKF